MLDGKQMEGPSRAQDSLGEAFNTHFNRAEIYRKIQRLKLHGCIKRDEDTGEWHSACGRHRKLKEIRGEITEPLKGCSWMSNLCA